MKVNGCDKATDCTVQDDIADGPNFDELVIKECLPPCEEHRRHINHKLQ